MDAARWLVSAIRMHLGVRIWQRVFRKKVPNHPFASFQHGLHAPPVRSKRIAVVVEFARSFSTSRAKRRWGKSLSAVGVREYSLPRQARNGSRHEAETAS